MKKFFRKSLILFVQLTYGATINRKIREFIYYFFSEEMLSFYLKQLKDSIWKLNDDNTFELIQQELSEKSDLEKIKTKNQARLKLLANTPGLFIDTVIQYSMKLARFFLYIRLLFILKCFKKRLCKDWWEKRMHSLVWLSSLKPSRIRK